MNRTFYILLCLACFSCGKKEHPHPLVRSTFKVKAIPKECKVQIFYKDRSFPSWKYQNKQSLYAVDTNSVWWYEEPDLNSALVGGTSYGHRVDYIRLIDTTIHHIPSRWYLSVQTVKRRITIGDSYFYGDVRELVYIPEKSLGPEKQVMMAPNDLYQCDQSDVRKTFQITSLSAEKFYSEPMADQWIRKSTLWTWNITQKKLSLPLKNSSKALVFKAVLEGGDGDKCYVHYETMESIHCYLIYCSYWEWFEFRLYDYNDGKLKAKTSGYPCISPDKKHMVTFTYSEMWEDIGIQLYEISGDLRFKQIKNFSFKNWAPCIEPLEMAWISNTEFKVKVQSFGKHFRSYDDWELEPCYGYLQFKIL